MKRKGRRSDADRPARSAVADGPAPRGLVFELQRGRYAIPLPAVSGLGDVGEVRSVPGAPAVVLGLVEWRGRLLTVIDLARLIDDGPSSDTGCLLRLAPPHDHLTLHVPAVVLVRDLEHDGDAGRRTLEPVALLADLLGPRDL